MLGESIVTARRPLLSESLNDSIEDMLDMICKGSDVIMIDFDKEMHEPIPWITDINKMINDRSVGQKSQRFALVGQAQREVFWIRRVQRL